MRRCDAALLFSLMRIVGAKMPPPDLRFRAGSVLLDDDTYRTEEEDGLFRARRSPGICAVWRESLFDAGVVVARFISGRASHIGDASSASAAAGESAPSRRSWAVLVI